MLTALKSCTRWPDVQAHDLSMKSAVAKQGLRGRAVKYHAVSALKGLQVLRQLKPTCANVSYKAYNLQCADQALCLPRYWPGTARYTK